MSIPLTAPLYWHHTLSIYELLRTKSKIEKSFYALDFIITNSGNAYLLEGNTGPGLDWNEKLKKNELEAKKLIRLVVEELVERSKVLVDAGEKFPKVHYLSLIHI